VPAKGPAAEADVSELWAEAEFYYQQGLFDEARKHYEEILELKPGERRAMERVVEINREKEEYQEFSRLADAVEGLESMIEAGPGASEDAVSPADADSVRSLMQEITEMRRGKTAAPAGKIPEKAPEPVKPPQREEPEESFADIDTEFQGAEALTSPPLPRGSPPRIPRSLSPTLIGSSEGPASLRRPLRRPRYRSLRGQAIPAISSIWPPSFGRVERVAGAEIARHGPRAEPGRDIRGVQGRCGSPREEGGRRHSLQPGGRLREMGLLDDAVSEFNMTNEGEPKFIQSRYMLGLCYLEKGDFETAISEIQNALGYSYSFGEASEERLGMHYDLALAFQGVGNSSSALEEFQKVFNLDPTYREVETKVHELQQGDFISMDAIKEDIEKEISFKFLEEGARIEREEKTKKSRK